ncbi:CidA/LrgA family protein [Liquorilactobacillus nagelii]|uniref:CidA/LrgA family protein n=1 Tax=Liquorilactobacillus nagelii TaxID=82688 RepID=UPI001CCF3A25|nr:CidA/LrgA family protein [Liquorilactobacillus nagelii]ULQ50191.1 CidA/LrgA family protein [Liquorilactobacillus nagelii]
MKTTKQTPSKKAASLLAQLGIYTVILFIANAISSLFPASFPVPAPVIGLILLYLLLTFHIIKLEWVDSVGIFLIGIIGFLFVPSGISLAANLKIMQQQGWQLILVIILSTIILLVVTAYTAKFFIWCRHAIKDLATKPHSKPLRPLNTLKISVSQHAKGGE